MGLRIPAVLAFTMACGGKKLQSDAAVADSAGIDGQCAVLCIPDGTDAGVCASNPYQCVSAQGTCAAGCMCTAYCFAEDAGITCPMCASPSRECPPGCGSPLG